MRAAWCARCYGAMCVIRCVGAMCVCSHVLNTDFPLLRPSTRYSNENLFPDVTNGFDRGSCCSFWTKDGAQELWAASGTTSTQTWMEENAPSSIASNYCKQTEELCSGEPSTCTTTTKGGTADCSRCPPCAGNNVLAEICVRAMVKTAKEQALVSLHTQGE